MNIKHSGIADLKQQGRSLLIWWLTGLLYLVPESLRQRLTHTPDRLIIEIVDQKYHCRLLRGNSSELLSESILNLNDELDRASFLRWYTPFMESGVKTILIVPDKQILHKTLCYPLSSEKSLSEILGFEMDRQTPFPADKVYFDKRITSRDQEQQRLTLQLFVVLRDKLEPILDALRSLQLRVDIVTSRLDGELIEGINLLPAQLRPVSGARLNPVTKTLAAVSLTMFLCALYVPLLRQQQILADLEMQLDQVKVQAKEAMPLMEERKRIGTMTEFLADKQAEQLVTINVLNELSRILPDNTWVNRLIIQKGEIQIFGESDAATAIIQLIENSNYFSNAQFRSPVTQNNVTKKDKFHVSATIARESAS